MPMIINWLCHEDLRFMQTLTDTEHAKCRTGAGLFELLSENFKPQNIDTTLSLQYCKLNLRFNHELLCLSDFRNLVAGTQLP